jgi:DNA-binding response OmpR family regulator
MTKILLVDDKELILYSLSKTLRNSGADVTTVTNGKDALQEIQKSAFDICFLDVQLPDANGLDLMKIIRDASSKTRIIIMTAVSLNEAQLQLMRDYSCLYLPKPFDLNQVQALVRELIGNPGATLAEA